MTWFDPAVAYRTITACDKEIDALKADIARLRAALESLTKDPPATLDEPDEDWEVVVKMRAIAREALAPKTGE
jgi:hypothetical protein